MYENIRTQLFGYLHIQVLYMLCTGLADVAQVCVRVCVLVCVCVCVEN